MKIISFSFPHVFQPGSSPAEDAEVLRVLLDALIQVNLVYLRYHPDTPSLYRSGVVYRRTQVWECIPSLYLRQYGDCKSLTAARVAELLRSGVQAKPTFRWNPRANAEGVHDFHILVQTHNGYEDPSRRLGMGKNENAYFAR